MQPEAEQSDLISLAEAAKLTGYHQDYLGSLCRSGKLQGKKMGRNWVVSQQSVLAFAHAADEQARRPLFRELASSALSSPLPISGSLDQSGASGSERAGAGQASTASSYNSTTYNFTTPSAPSTLNPSPSPELSFSLRRVAAAVSGVVALVASLVFIVYAWSPEPVGVVTVSNRAYGSDRTYGFTPSNSPLNQGENKSGAVLGDSTLVPVASSGTGQASTASTYNPTTYNSTTLSAPSPLDFSRLGISEYQLNGLIAQQLTNLASIGLLGVPSSSSNSSSSSVPSASAYNSTTYNFTTPSAPPLISYIQPAPSQNFSGASLLSATDLSSKNFTTATANITDTATIKTLSVTDTASIAGDLTVTGTITGNVSGTINPNLTTGSLLFQGPSGIAQDNTNLFWDNTNKRLGVGTSSPSFVLEVATANPIAIATMKDDGLTITDTTPNNAVAAGAGAGLRFRAQTNYGSTTLGSMWAETEGSGVNGSLYFATRGPAGSTAADMVLRADGNLGIGTTSPAAKLDVAGQLFTSGAIQYTDAGGGRVALFTPGGTTMALSNFNGALQLQPFSSGPVEMLTSLMVGHSNPPLSKVDVYGNMVVGTGYAGFTAAPTNGLLVQGNIGVGTTSPTAAMHVFKANDQQLRLDASGQYTYQYFANNGTGKASLGWDNTAGTMSMFADAASSQLVFGAAGSEKMRITAAGNVGIGTTAAAAKLHVISTDTTNGQLRVGYDTANYLNVTTSAGGSVFKANGTGIGVGTAFTFYPESIGSVGGWKIASFRDSANAEMASLSSTGTLTSVALNTGGGKILGDSSSLTVNHQIIANTTGGWDPLTVQTAGTTNLIVKNGGNVGIGTTAPSAAFEVYGNSASRFKVNGTTGATDVYIGDATGEDFDVHYGVGAPSVFAVNYSNMTLNAWNAAQPYTISVGSNVSRLTINGSASVPVILQATSGNVGIGTTSPASKFDVSTTSTAGVELARFGNTASGYYGTIGLDGSGFMVLSSPGGSKSLSIGTSGIGVNGAASYPLHVNSGAAAGAVIARIAANGGYGVDIGTNGSGDGFVGSATPNNFIVRTNGADRITVLNSNGNVGIGTTSPTASLDVVGSINNTNGSPSGNRFSGTYGYVSMNTQLSPVSGSRVNSFLQYLPSSYGTIGVVGRDSFNFWLGGDAYGSSLFGTQTVAGSPNLYARARIDADTFTAASAQTITTAATLLIGQAPANGTNVTITNPFALYVNSGNSYFGGNVGIGTTAPVGAGATQVTISGNAAAAASNYGSLALRNPNTNTAYTWGSVDFYGGSTAGAQIQGISVAGGTAYGKLAFSVNNNGTLTNNMVLDSGALTIGYGNGTVSSQIKVYSSSANGETVGISLGNPNTPVNSNIALAFESYNLGTYRAKIVGEAAQSNTDYGNMTFYTRNASGMNPVMHLNMSGNVGIGTTSPSARLQINGAGSDYSTNALLVRNNSGSDLLTIRNGNGSTVSSRAVAVIGGAWNDFSNYSSSFWPLYAAAFPGNVAIGSDGTTNRSSRTLDFFVGYSDAGEGTSAVPAGFIKASNTGTGPSDGSLALGAYRANIGGQTLTSQEVMRLLYNGNVGIGTTSPSAKFEVKGSGTGNVLIGEWAGSSSFGAISLNGSFTTNNYNFTSSSSDDLYINRPTGRNIRVREGNSSEQLTILASGNVGIGTTSPGYKLDVSGAGNFSGALMLDNAGGGLTFRRSTYNDWQLFTANPGFGKGFTIYEGTANAYRIFIAEGGNVGIGTTNPIFPLDVQTTVNSNQSYGYLNSSGLVGTSSGTNAYSIRASGRVLASEFNAVSDSRLKNVQFELSPALSLDLITQLRPVSFTWKDNPTGQPILGFLAQEVEGVIPNAVSRVATANFADQRELSYNQLVAVAIGSIKELHTQLANVQQELQSAQAHMQGANSLAGSTPITIAAHLYLSADSVGQVKILAGSTSVRVTFTKPYEQQPVVTATARGKVVGSYWVQDEDASGFTLYIEQAQAEAVTFSWHAFASPEAKLTVSDGTTQRLVLILPTPFQLRQGFVGQANSPLNQGENQTPVGEVAGESAGNDHGNNDDNDPVPLEDSGTGQATVPLTSGSGTGQAPEPSPTLISTPDS